MINIEEFETKFETNRVYRHYKGNYYYVMDLAEHTETNELMVVYHALYGDYECYVRPFVMFVEELDDEKKSWYKQECRFVPVDMNK